MRDKDTQDMVLRIIERVIEADRDFTVNITHHDSSVLGTVSKNNGVNISITSFVSDDEDETDTTA